MIMKSEMLVKKTTPGSLNLEDGDTCVSHTLIDKSLKKNQKRRSENYKFGFKIVFYVQLFLIIHTRISEIHMFNFVNDSKGSLHLIDM